MKLHSGHLSRTDALCVVGGAGKNRFLRQMIADIFDSKTYNIQHAGFAAALGCAISGARRILNISYDEAADRFVQVEQASSMRPAPENQQTILKLLRRYEELEKGAIRRPPL